DARVTSYLALSAALTVAWLLAVQIAGGYELRQVATGASGCQRGLPAAFGLAGGLAIVAYLSQLGVGRPFLAIVIPVGAVLQILARLAVRHAVYARRARGEWTNASLAVGTSEAVRHLVEVTRRNRYAGLVVVGACVEDAE